MPRAWSMREGTESESMKAALRFSSSKHRGLLPDECGFELQPAQTGAGLVEVFIFLGEAEAQQILAAAWPEEG
jgi:hypothetical protein